MKIGIEFEAKVISPAGVKTSNVFVEDLVATDLGEAIGKYAKYIEPLFESVVCNKEVDFDSEDAEANIVIGLNNGNKVELTVIGHSAVKCPSWDNKDGDMPSRVYENSTLYFENGDYALELPVRITEFDSENEGYEYASDIHEQEKYFLPNSFWDMKEMAKEVAKADKDFFLESIEANDELCIESIRLKRHDADYVAKLKKLKALALELAGELTEMIGEGE